MKKQKFRTKTTPQNCTQEIGVSKEFMCEFPLSLSPRFDACPAPSSLHRRRRWWVGRESSCSGACMSCSALLLHSVLDLTLRTNQARQGQEAAVCMTCVPRRHNVGPKLSKCVWGGSEEGDAVSLAASVVMCHTRKNAQMFEIMLQFARCML